MGSSGLDSPHFSAHNIRLDDGTLTKPDEPWTMDAHPSFLSAKRVLQTVFPGDRKLLRIADLGCLEGGYSVEFARMGFEVLGVDVRESNIAACNYAKSKTVLPNLSFVQDNAWNIANYGEFGAVFCRGLLYHLDKPKQFLGLLSSVTRKLLIVDTHFATSEIETCCDGAMDLSSLCENEGLLGRWLTEFLDDTWFGNREFYRWSSWDNRRSFWIMREYLIQSIYDAGFDMVMECFDTLAPKIAESMTTGYYKTDGRGTFIGIKS